MIKSRIYRNTTEVMGLQVRDTPFRRPVTRTIFSSHRGVFTGVEAHQ